jgi:zinc finger CCCH domain-containing protein 13
MNIAPGEPVPPGFENEVKPMADIQKALDVYKDQPLVGLEYLSELEMGGGKELNYHCILCDKQGFPRTIFAHLISQSHRHRFLVSILFQSHSMST